MLKRINFFISSIFPQKLYWHSAGLVHPWESVIEGINNPSKLYQKSDDLVKLLKKLKLINKNTKVLDIGCGVGRLEYKLGKEVKFCLGIDIAPSMIALAKKNTSTKNVKFMVVNGRDLSGLGSMQFALIFSMIVFQHLPRNVFKNYVRDSYKHLKNKGKLFFQIPIYKGSKPLEPPINHPWAVRSYNLKELEKILKSSGFKNIKFYSVEGNKLIGHEDQVFVLGVK